MNKYLFSLLITLFVSLFSVCCYADIKVEENELMQRLEKHIRFNPNGENRIGHLYIGGHDTAISQSTWLYVKNALDYYKENKPAFIILELDSPGGEVFVSQKISDALKEIDINYGIPVVALINNWAISAGAMLAYSCRFIAIVKDASMGAAEPVIPGEGGKMESASEKVNSALRADFSNRASFFDRNADVAVAMVDKDSILVLRDGKILRLDSEDQIRKGNTGADEIISAKGKLLTLDAEDMVRLGVADIALPAGRLEPRTAAELSSGKWPAKKSPLFQHPFFAKITNAVVDGYVMDWKTMFFAFLVNPAVQSILFMGMLIGFYLEIQSPGVGLPGGIAATCLFLLALSNFAIEAATWLEVIMIIAGLGLIVVELLILPGFGLPGILGIVLFVVGSFALILPEIGDINYDIDNQTLNAAGEEFLYRLTWLSGALVLGILLLFVLARFFQPKFMAFSHLVLEGEEESSKGFVAGALPDKMPQVGDEGIVVATLRPAGKIVIGNKLYDALSDGDFLEQGTPVRVIRVMGGHVTVEEVRD
jgi:membrane-bound serine protease (ClpP class)